MSGPTKKIDKFDPASCHVVRASLQEALKGVSEQHGVAFDVGNMSYDENGFRTRLDCRVIPKEGDLPVMAQDFLNLAEMYGLHPSHLGRVFSTRDGRSFKVSGLQPRKKKYKVTAECTKTGKPYGFTIADVSSKLSAGK